MRIWKWYKKAVIPEQTVLQEFIEEGKRSQESLDRQERDIKTTRADDLNTEKMAAEGNWVAQMIKARQDHIVHEVQSRAAVNKAIARSDKERLPHQDDPPQP